MERKGVGIPPSEGEGSTEAVRTFILASSSWFLPSFRPIIWFLFLYLTYLGTLLWVCMHLSVKMDLEVKAFGMSKTHAAWNYLDFRPTRSLSVHVYCLPCPKEEEAEIP